MDYSTMYFGNHHIDLHYGHFTQAYTKTFYYDALPAKKPGDTDADFVIKSNEVNSLKNKLEQIDGIHVYLGTSHVRRKRIEQKQVDMMTAIDMLTHTFRSNMHKATLLTADADFIPLVDALVQHGMYVTLLYGDTEHCRTSDELISSADARRRLTVEDVYRSSSREFKDNFSIPSVHIGPKIAGATVLSDWEDAAYGTVQWQSIDGDRIVAIAEKTNKDYFTQVRFHDHDKLKLFMKDQYKMNIPDHLTR